MSKGSDPCCVRSHELIKNETGAEGNSAPARSGEATWAFGVVSYWTAWTAFVAWSEAWVAAAVATSVNVFIHDMGLNIA